jgi:hypothetical protein
MLPTLQNNTICTLAAAAAPEGVVGVLVSRRPQQRLQQQLLHHAASSRAQPCGQPLLGQRQRGLHEVFDNLVNVAAHKTQLRELGSLNLQALGHAMV